ncbi:MAG: class B sortase [Bacilli bacterium]
MLLTALNWQTIVSYQKQYNNEDIIGKITIKDTNIDEIVTKTRDNAFYLNHSLTKENDIKGSVFADYRINLYNAKKIILYGHNSKKYEASFKDLEKYLDEDYYLNHKYINLLTKLYNRTYEIFSVAIYKNDYPYLKTQFNKDTWLIHLKQLKAKSLYDTKVLVDDDDEILVLQTCSKVYDNSFLVISAKLR